MNPGRRHEQQDCKKHFLAGAEDASRSASAMKCPFPTCLANSTAVTACHLSTGLFHIAIFLWKFFLGPLSIINGACSQATITTAARLRQESSNAPPSGPAAGSESAAVIAKSSPTGKVVIYRNKCVPNRANTGQMKQQKFTQPHQKQGSGQESWQLLLLGLYTTI